MVAFLGDYNYSPRNWICDAIAMMIKDHVLVTFAVFRKGYDEVHEWIDSDSENWFGTGRSPYRHWVKYHNLKAIEKKYGKNIERNVAMLHVICDWLSHFGIFALPQDSKEVEDNLKLLNAFY